MTIKEMLELVGASSVQAVQGGRTLPEPVSIPPSSTGSIAFEDLATGGSMISYWQRSAIYWHDFIVLNFMNFFIEESCGSCGPCRSLTVIVRNKLQKILDGNGTRNDIDELYTWAKLGKPANRCGLGQTAANPIITSLLIISEASTKVLLKQIKVIYHPSTWKMPLLNHVQPLTGYRTLNPINPGRIKE